MIITIDTSLIESKNYDENGLNIQENKFEQLMHLYSLAMRKVEEKVNSINQDYKKIYEKDIINHIVCRLKSPQSIIKKMQRKNYELTYKNLIDKINDIAGVRAICPIKSNIFEVVNLIRESDDFKIIKEKDYVTKPKETGYASYHIILEVPIELDDVKLCTKVEIQIRTMAMDFWATLEHEIKYKSSGKIPTRVSKELTIYAKIIDKLDNKLMSLCNKKYKRKIELIK